MPLNNASMYIRLSNFQDLLGDEPIIYIYGKDKELATQQLSLVNGICKSKNIKTGKVYMDIGGSNRLNYKINLKKLINENKNNNILVLNGSRLTRDTFELFELKSLFHKNNLNIYDLTSDSFVFDNNLELLEEIYSKGSDKDLQRNLDVLYVEPNKLPVKMTIKNTLEEKQKLVGGLIEYTYIDNCDDVAIVCNEEGKLLGLPLNRDVGHDIICGNFFIVGDDPEFGEDRSLTEEQIDKYSKIFGKKSIEKTNQKFNEIMLNSLNDYYM